MAAIHDIFSPYTAQKIGSIALENSLSIDKKLDRAVSVLSATAPKWPAHKRIALLEALIQKITERKETFIMLIVREGGKPYKDAAIEVERAINGIGIAIAELYHLQGQQVPMGLTAPSEGRFAFTIREPIGVVVAISAFNHPLNLIIHQLIPAIAVGTPILIKPALEAPGCCMAIVKILYELGLPEEWCQVVVCSNDDSAKLASDPRVAFVSFIGSAAVGWKLRSQLAPGAVCALEHGGAAPVVIDEGVDSGAVLPGLLKGAFYHAGQVCVSIQRIFIPQAGARLWAESLAHQAAQLKVGNPESEQTDIGPLIRQKDVVRVHQWVEEAIREGAVCLTGGKLLDQPNCYPPTVLYNPPQHTHMMQKEIFGPVVNIIPYQDLEEAFRLANNVPFSFQASFYSNNLQHISQAMASLKANTVLINDPTVFRVDWMPFGGSQQSGMGKGGIGYTMRDYTKEKLLIVNPG